VKAGLEVLFVHAGSFTAVLVHFAILVFSPDREAGVRAALPVALIVMSGYVLAAYRVGLLKQFDIDLAAEDSGLRDHQPDHHHLIRRTLRGAAALAAWAPQHRLGGIGPTRADRCDKRVFLRSENARSVNPRGEISERAGLSPK
jgi:hypothetical protein